MEYTFRLWQSYHRLDLERYDGGTDLSFKWRV